MAHRTVSKDKIDIRPLTKLSLSNLKSVASGYISDSKYIVDYRENENAVSFDLQLVSLRNPYVKKWDFDDDTLQSYEQILNKEFSFGAFVGQLLVGLIIAEPHEWNRSMWVWELHTREKYRNKGISTQLMASAAKKAKEAGFRTIVCETQNTNVIAIKVYRKLGFRLEGIDISYYSNHDYPDGELAVFMKRRLP